MNLTFGCRRVVFKWEGFEAGMTQVYLLLATTHQPKLLGKDKLGSGYLRLLNLNMISYARE